MNDTAVDAALAQKLEKLKEIIAQTDGLAVAFSGGVDSTYLAAVTGEVLGDRALAVTAHSPLYPEHEQTEASQLAERIGIHHVIVDSDELDVPGFADNPPNRCYLCKTELFTTVKAVAAKHGITAVADGTNADDKSDYRPGRKAARECGVLSPLLEAELSKEEIRTLSRQLGLPTAEKAAFACLASRFPYGSRIDEPKLKSVGAVEGTLRELGFHQFRVRHHGDVARIEVLPDDIQKLMAEPARSQVVSVAREAGFQYVAADMVGYRTGSMNETLTQARRDKSA